MNRQLARLALRRGFDRRHECPPAPRPGGLDRWLALLIGQGLRWLDGAAWNRLGAAPALRWARAQGLCDLDDARLDALWQLQRQALRRAGLEPQPAQAALAITAELAWRTLGVRPHAEQIAGAALMLRGQLVEMATGEGKSLTAALAAAIAASAGLPVEVFTVNDYLAQRDAEGMARFYGRLGLEVAALVPGQDPAAREAVQRADVVYAVNKDYVFEHLRWRTARGEGAFAGRGLYFAIVDEADSILIDEARTPLILAQPSTRLGAPLLRRVRDFAAGLVEGDDHELEPRERRATLTAAGRERTAALKRAGLPGGTWPDRLLHELVEQALAAAALYRRDRDYLVADGRIAIIDEYTGRVLADRSWERGLHQFIELAEGLEPTPVNETIAGTTFPEFYRRYLMLAGASGTLAETAAELRAVYGLRVRRLPTHRPVRRRVAGPHIYRHAAARWQAVEVAVQAALARGQAVLVGTRSVAASEEIAARLRRAGLAPAVLNAREHADEARIVAEAGGRGRVTVATNMAGRGTDIRIDDTVRAAGGLLVILTELHESARIDRQLLGRCARQGDPGEGLLLASLDDELFRQHLPLATRWAGSGDAPLGRPLALLLRGLAQRAAEARHRAERALVLDRNERLGHQLGFAGRNT